MQVIPNILCSALQRGCESEPQMLVLIPNGPSAPAAGLGIISLDAIADADKLLKTLIIVVIC